MNENMNLVYEWARTIHDYAEWAQDCYEDSEYTKMYMYVSQIYGAADAIMKATSINGKDG